MKRLIADRDWIAKKVCTPATSELFFKADEERPSKKRTEDEEAALAICARCPVSGNCLEYALKNVEVGIWGGTTTDMRRSIRRVGYKAGCPRCRSRMLTRDADTQICLSCALSWLL